MTTPSGRISARRLSHEPVLLVVAVVLLILLVAYPLVMIFEGAFRLTPPGIVGERGLDNVRSVLTSGRFYQALVNSTIVGVSVTVFSVLFGTMFAWLTRRTDLPLKGLFHIAFIVPLFLPSYVIAMAWATLLAPHSGIVNVALVESGLLEESFFDIYTLAGIIAVMTISYMPFSYLYAWTALRYVDPALEEASKVTGASQFRTTMSVTLPLIMPGITIAAVLVFVTSFGYFGVPAVLGMPRGIPVLGTLIYEYVSQFPPRHGEAAVIGIFLTIFIAGLVLLQRRLISRGRQYTSVTGKGFRHRLVAMGKWRFFLLAVCLSYALLAVVLPLLMLGRVATVRFWAPSQTFSPIDFDSFNFVLFEHGLTGRAIGNSVLLAAVAATVMLAIALTIAASERVKRSRWISKAVVVISGLPIAIPGVVIGLALLWAWIQVPLPIYGTGIILVIAYLTRYLPYGVSSVDSTWRQLDPGLEEAAQVTGASWWRRTRGILIPLLKPGLAAAWMLVFIQAIRELATVILLYGYETPIMSAVIYELWSEGSYPLTASMGLIQVAIIGVAMVVLRKIVGDEAFTRI